MYTSLRTSTMSGLSVDFSRKPSRGKRHSVRAGSLSWDSKMSSRERKFSSMPTPGCTGRYDCVSIICVCVKSTKKTGRQPAVKMTPRTFFSCVYNSSSLFWRQESLANGRAAKSRPEQSNRSKSSQQYCSSIQTTIIMTLHHKVWFDSIWSCQSSNRFVCCNFCDNHINATRMELMQLQ